MAVFTIRFYDIRYCGYYRWSSDVPEVGGCDFLLRELSEWSINKQLRHTRLPMKDQFHPAYLAAINVGREFSSFCLWNEVPSDSGRVASVLGAARVGNAAVRDNDIAQGHIPGFPTYFAIWPRRNLLISLRDESSTSLGTSAAANYLESFLTSSTSLAVVDRDDPLMPTITGYTNPATGEVEALHPRFFAGLIRNRETGADLVANADRIRKIVRVKELTVLTPRDNRFFQAALRWMDVRPAPGDASLKIRQELSIGVTAQELHQLIEREAESVEPRKNDIGFYYRGEQSPRWLSGGIAMMELDLPILKDNGIYQPSDIADQLSHHRRNISNALP